MPVSIKGSGGGSVTLDAGAAAANSTLTLPNTSGTVINTAPSTAGNVLTSNGTAWVSSAPTAASLTLLATLTTTSGTTQTVTSLSTSYTAFIIVMEGVGNSTGSDAVRVRASTNNGSSYVKESPTYLALSSPAYGNTTIWRASSSVLNRTMIQYGNNANPGGTQALINTASSAPINALQFFWNAGYTFNAGAIYIYGWN